MATCSGCGAAAPAEAKFCGVCGRPQGALAGVQPAPAPMPHTPPMPPPMPVMPQMTRGFGGGGGGQSRQVPIMAAAHDAFAHGVRAIGAAGGELLWQQPPQAKFLLTRKGLWTTAGVALRYDGDLRIAPAGAGQSTARVALKLQWGSAVPLLLLQAGSVLVAAMFNYYVAAFALIIIAVTLAYTAWNVSSGIPERALNDIAAALQNGAAPAFAAPAPSAPPVAAYTPPAPTPAPTPTPAPPAAPALAAAPAPDRAASVNAVTEQIMQIAALRDAGAITVEEFEAKKKELLSRI